MNKIFGIFALIFSTFSLWIGAIAAYITALAHTAGNDEWINFAIGLVFAPWGVIHGILIWIGLS